MEFEHSSLAPRFSLSSSRSQAAIANSLQHGGGESRRQEALDSAAFWLLGFLNNSAYVIMNAGANEISSGAVGLTYLCGILPALLVKLTGPYWFHYLSYNKRSWVIATLMSMSYLVVAFGSSLPLKLAGVALGSLQGGLGEATCLAMASFYDSRRVITYWSSGTGFAGVFGFAWVIMLHDWLGLSFREMLLLANLSSAAWLAVYYLLLQPPEKKPPSKLLARSSSEAPQPDDLPAPTHATSDRANGGGSENQEDPLLRSQGERKAEEDGRASATRQMTFQERWVRTRALWPFIVPLTLVYFAEYSMQAGTWAAIGFPVTDVKKRKEFYGSSNFWYQAGVFVSRSSGLVFQADLKLLWAMPVMQLGFLIFFFFDAWLHFWYNYGLLVLCGMTGLLGGAVYVNAFTLISKEVDPKYREFSLSAASLGDSLGIAFADIFSIIIQGCLFRINGLEGASFTC